MKIFYDGECYFCTNFVKLLRLRQAVGDVQLISLRDNNDDARRVLSSGVNVNSGFVVEHNGQVFHGSHAFHYLNTLAEPKNLLSRLLFQVGKYPRAARALYPLMVVGRYLVLIGQGRALIDRRPQPMDEGPEDSLGARMLRVSALLLAFAGMARLLISPYYPLGSAHAVSVAFLAAGSSGAWIALFLKAARARRLYQSIRHATPAGIIGYLAVWFISVNCFDMVLFRRAAGFMAVLPLIAVALELYRRHSKDPSVGKVPAAVPLVLLLFAFFPGLYLAPFYGGIFGWTAHTDRSAPVAVGGYKLVTKEGDAIWYNHAFLQPITMNWRLRLAFLGGIPDEAKFIEFMFDNYERIYPALEAGRMPHEWALGRFAYPSHNLSDSNALDYSDKFAPSKIVGMQVVTEYYSFGGDFISADKGALVPVGAH